MNSLIQSISKIFGGAVRAFQTFPAAIICALSFTVVTLVRIQLDWPAQEPYNLLFNCLHWAFATGAVFSMAAITTAQSLFNNKKTFLTANILGIAAAAITFLLLYLLGGEQSDIFTSQYAVVSDLAAARTVVAILVSFLVFIVMAGYPKDQSDFAHSFFMTQKAFIIALIYGLVIMAGSSGVAGAVQALIYSGMSEKVYMYIGTFTGFLVFTIFLGYFPDFRKGSIDEHREIAQKQPRFIEILFGYIMIPIVLALTAVLFVWAGKTIVSGEWPSFMQLSRIAIAYSLGGLWLHIMVTHYESGLAKFYRRFYPIAALIILAFEAGALLTQLGKYGLKITEYYFILVWVIAVMAAILLLLLKVRAHLSIIALTCALAVFSVLPFVGYHALPVAVQVDRLENLLLSQGMLKSNQLIPASEKPELSIRESITDAVNYLANAEDSKLPTWFDKRLNENDVFKEKLGFEQVWPEWDDVNNGGPGRYLSTSLYLKPEAIDVSDYDWGIILQEDYAKDRKTATVKGNNGIYEINWTRNSMNGIAALEIKLKDQVILKQEMSGYIDEISEKYPPGQTNPRNATFDDMSLVLKTKEADVLLVFSNIEISLDIQEDNINYWINLNTLYLKEKPI